MDLSPDDDGQGMSDAIYEEFPLVTVTNNEGRTLKEPILPRGKFKVYVPLRMFKALLGAKLISERVLEISRESIDASTIPGIVSNRAADLGFHEDSDSDGFVFVRTETRITPSTDPIPVVKRLQVAMPFLIYLQHPFQQDYF